MDVKVGALSGGQPQPMAHLMSTTIMVTDNLRYAIEYVNRLVMIHQGNAILYKNGEEKAKMSVDDILALFNEISIECGN